jgi:prolyl 4-hydroxylase
MDLGNSCIDLFDNSISPEVCEDIISRFEADCRKFDGTVGYGDGASNIDHSLKKCTEVYISQHADWKDIDEIVFKEISSKMTVLRDRYPGLANVNAVNDEGYRVKKYENDGTEFFNWHIDQTGIVHGHRYLVFQWYLNTVEEGGETEFRLQGVQVKPVQGRLACFPPFWTHEHRGLAPVSGPKYVLSSWITF